MKNQSLLMLCLLALLSVSCKTQDAIRRERSAETNDQVQKSTATMSARFNVLEEQVARLNGQLEEAVHAKGETIKENQKLFSRIQEMEEVNLKQSEYIKTLADKVNEQTAYLEEVISSLGKLSEKPSSKKKVEIDNSSDKVVPATFKNGLAAYRKKNYDEAKSIFSTVSETKKAKKNDKEGAIHYLGMIEYQQKRYESAKVYFSKVFTETPDSKFAAPALLGLAKTFIKLKSKDEASLTLDELVARFPKSKEATEAQGLKAKL